MGDNTLREIAYIAAGLRIIAIALVALVILATLVAAVMWWAS